MLLSHQQDAVLDFGDMMELISTSAGFLILQTRAITAGGYANSCNN